MGIRPKGRGCRDTPAGSVKVDSGPALYQYKRTQKSAGLLRRWGGGGVGIIVEGTAGNTG
jgi:hypothetical protein